MSDKEKEQNTHIDFSRSSENNYLVSKSLKELYKTEFGQAQKDYNDKQKRADRKITNYYEQVQKGKKTSLQQEMILQVGDKDDFKDNPENQKLANELLEEWFQKFEERNPNLKVYNAVIHNDEASPHMHLNFVPVATGYKRGMEKQVSFDRAILQQDQTLNKERPFEEWRNQEVQLLEKMLKERGLERSLIGTNDFKDVNDLKSRKDEIRELEQQTLVARKELAEVNNKLQEDSQRVLKATRDSKRVESIQVEKGRLFDRGSVKMSVEDFETLKTLALASEGLRTKITALHVDAGIVGMRNAELKAEKEVLQNENSELKKENENLRAENKELKSEVSKLNLTLQHLQKVLAIMKNSAEKQLSIGKEKFNEFVGASRLHELTNRFGKEKSFMPEVFKKMIPEDEVRGAEKYVDIVKGREMKKEQEEVVVEKEKISNNTKNKEADFER